MTSLAKLLLLVLLVQCNLLLLPARWFPALATGTASVPNTIGAQSGPNLAASLLDANWTALVNYINAREIVQDVLASRPVASVIGRWYYATDTGQLFADTGAAWTTVGSNPLGGWSVRNLVGTPGDSTGLTPLTQFSVTADVVALRNPQTGALAVVTASATLTNNTATSGPTANGRDRSTGFSDGNRFVHLYYIYNGTTLATLSSTCSTTNVGGGTCSIYGGPTLPSGYTSWAYIGPIQWQGTFTQMDIRGAYVSYRLASSALTNGTAVAETSVSLASQVASNALRIQLRGDLEQTAAAAPSNQTATVRYVTNSNHTILRVRGGAAWVQADTQAFIVPNVVQRVFYILSGVTNSEQFDLDVLGYFVNNGGE